MNRIRGAQLRRIDEYEYMAKSAMANAYAQGAGRKAKEKKIFDRDKAIRMLDRNDHWRNARERDMSRMKKLTEALKTYTPNFKPKGG